MRSRFAKFGNFNVAISGDGLPLLRNKRAVEGFLSHSKKSLQTFESGGLTFRRVYRKGQFHHKLWVAKGERADFFIKSIFQPNEISELSTIQFATLSALAPLSKGNVVPVKPLLAADDGVRGYLVMPYHDLPTLFKAAHKMPDSLLEEFDTYSNTMRTYGFCDFGQRNALYDAKNGKIIVIDVQRY